MTVSRRNYSPTFFRIKLIGRLEDGWSDWFGEMVVTTDGSETILSGSLADQAALHGLLNRIRDLNLTLLAVESFEPGRKNED